ncbi:histone-fold-containing protein [Lineolata rhizophorae]|uniref:Histone-fold-containing protein n=1 Tax=Lineolata rhizophorae TaxID=578093 RepID=A0A6A6NZW8_9PEZI|nr:histone-fold-containing protein [Lineolata rhizophorae]
MQQVPMQPGHNPPRYDGQNGNPLYDTRNGGHYGASASIAAAGKAPSPEVFQGQWSNVNQGLNGQYRDILNTYWQQQITKLEQDEHDYKLHQLPLARIKKVMKADPEVKMISAEAPILFAKGCDIFITELTMRAWIHAEENKRRTLQRSDIASALAKSDMFDFLIDIVPREEATGHKRSGGQGGSSGQQAPPTAPAPGGHPGQQPGIQQQPGVHPPPQQMPDYGMGQHMPGEQDFRSNQAMYGAAAPSGGAPGAPGGVQHGDPAAFGQPHGAPPQGMFDQNMYGAYGMPAQPVSDTHQ